jgi:hypothetical protein
MPKKSPFRQTYGIAIPDDYPSIERIPGLAEYLSALRRAIKGSIDVAPGVLDQLRAFQTTWWRLSEAAGRIPPNVPEAADLKPLLEAGSRIADLLNRTAAFAVPAALGDELRVISETSRQIRAALPETPQLVDVARELDELRETAERAQVSVATAQRR